jgi:localization factor PodJL
MNGSRSNSQRTGNPSYGDRPSLDALNRTIEGLEARIEGLMSSVSREPRQPERQRPAASDAVSEILQRQRALHAARERPLRERIAARDPDLSASRTRRPTNLLIRQSPRPRVLRPRPMSPGHWWG